MLSPCRTAETKSDASPLPARGGQGQAPPLLTYAPPWWAPLLIRKPTNHPERLAVPANSGDRSGRRRGRLNLSPNRKVKTPIAFGVAVPANPDTRSARRRGHRRVWPNRKIKTESPLRLDEYGSGVAVAGVAPKRRSLSALCTAAASVFPRPPSRLQSLVGAAFRGRTVGRFTPAPVRPAGAPSTPPGRAWRPLRGDRRDPPAEVTFVLPGPGRHRFALTAGPRAFPRTAPRPQKPANAPPIRFCLVLRAVGRQTLRADCLCPPG